MENKFFETRRFDITESKFKAYIRASLKKVPELAGFAEMIDRSIGHLDKAQEPTHTIHRMEDDNNQDDYDGIYHDDEGRFQDYYKPSTAARSIGINGYNIIYEFDYDDEKTGSGYCYIAVFLTDRQLPAP